MKPGPEEPGASTTIAIVAAEAAHAGMARALYPVHTLFDGDLVFAVSTGARPLGEAAALEMVALEHAAAHCLARAIARAVYAAKPQPGNLLPCWSELGSVGLSRKKTK